MVRVVWPTPPTRKFARILRSVDAWLAGNLARDDASELAEQLRGGRVAHHANLPADESLTPLSPKTMQRCDSVTRSTMPAWTGRAGRSWVGRALGVGTALSGAWVADCVLQTAAGSDFEFALPLHGRLSTKARYDIEGPGIREQGDVTRTIAMKRVP